MDRAEFLEMCKRASMIPKGKAIPPELFLKFDSTVFYPVGYILRFDSNGKPTHTAILHDLKAHSISYCDLLKVERM